MELGNVKRTGKPESGGPVSNHSLPPDEGHRPARTRSVSSTVVRYVDVFRAMAKKTKSPAVYVLLALFILISLALAVFILVREMTIVKKLQHKCGSERHFLEHRYPGYFRTVQQQREFIETLQELERERVRQETTEGVSCQFQCNREQPFLPPGGGVTNAPARRKRDTNIRWTYHSCCQSYKNHSSSPIFAEDVRGRMRELVQTDSYRQYFPQEICRQVRGCQGCTCTQPDPEVTQAVVYKNKNAVLDDEKYELEYLNFPGCCKCLNIGISLT